MIGILKALKGTRSTGLILLEGKVVTSTGGDIASTDCKGFTVVKTATKTGRYTVQLVKPDGTVDTALKLAGGVATLIGADDAAFTDDKGTQAAFRDDDIASDGTIELQWMRPDSQADAEIQDGHSFVLALLLRDSAVI